MSGLYIHIPFCKKACAYCDFHFSTSLKGKAEVVDAICDDLRLNADWLEDKKLESIYFGGGTPSLLSFGETALIFETINKLFSVDQKAEITFEVNPDDVHMPQLKEWHSLGINRLSIGLQSFNNEELAWMNRAHTAAQSVESVKMAQDSGFSNITIDLIYGSKFQSLGEWENTLQKACELNTQHISAYNLTIESKTRLGIKHKRGIEPPVDEDLSRQEFLMMSSYLENAGFVHYEISNFGKPGYLAVHNSNYWRGKHYLGVGPSAHSFNGVSRKWNLSSNAAYVRGVKQGGTYSETEILTVENRYNEYVLTRLRTIWGCSSDEIGREFGERIKKHFLTNIADHSQYIIQNGEVFTLTLEGKLRADGISASLFI